MLTTTLRDYALQLLGLVLLLVLLLHFAPTVAATLSSALMQPTRKVEHVKITL